MWDLHPTDDGGSALVSEHFNIKLYKMTTYVLVPSDHEQSKLDSSYPRQGFSSVYHRVPLFSIRCKKTRTWFGASTEH